VDYLKRHGIEPNSFNLKLLAHITNTSMSSASIAELAGLPRKDTQAVDEFVKKLMESGWKNVLSVKEYGMRGEPKEPFWQLGEW